MSSNVGMFCRRTACPKKCILQLAKEHMMIYNKSKDLYDACELFLFATFVILVAGTILNPPTGKFYYDLGLSSLVTKLTLVFAVLAEDEGC